MRVPTVKQNPVHRVIAALTGSCSTITTVLESLELDPDLENDEEFCADLDDEIFCCEECDWWFENSEMVESEGGQYCNDCRNSINDEG